MFLEIKTVGGLHAGENRKCVGKSFPSIQVKEAKFVEVFCSNWLKSLFLEWKISKRETLLYGPNGMVRNSGLLLMRIGAANMLISFRLSVRVVSSHRGGLGKTLFVRRLTEQLPNLVNNDMVLTNLRRKDSKTFLHVTVPLHGNSTDSSMLVDALLPHAVKANVPLSRIFHLDVSPSVRC